MKFSTVAAAALTITTVSSLHLGFGSSKNLSKRTNHHQDASLTKSTHNSHLIKNKAAFVTISDDIKIEDLLKNVKSEKDLDAVIKKVDESYNKLSKAPFTEAEKIQLRVEYELLKSIFEFVKTGKIPEPKPNSIFATKKIQEKLEKATTSQAYNEILQQVDIGYTELLAKDPKREIELKAEHTVLKSIIVEVQAYLLEQKIIKRSLPNLAKDALVSYAKRQITSYIQKF